MTAEDKKRKRSEMILHVFVKDDVVVDGTQRNVAPPPCVIAKKGLVIREPEAGPQRSIIQDSPEAKEMFKLMEYEIESRNDVVRAREIVEKNLDGIEVQLSAKHEMAVKGLSE
ncbi:hypothetical protein Tco_1224234 [Tanacetum coccineum]